MGYYGCGLSKPLQRVILLSVESHPQNEKIIFVDVK